MGLDCCTERDDSSKIYGDTPIKLIKDPCTNPAQMCALYDTFIFDIDGTLVHDSNPIPGVIESIYKLMIEHKKKVLFYTNSGYTTRE